jgi:hypothetical protein
VCPLLRKFEADALKDWLMVAGIMCQLFYGYRLGSAVGSSVVCGFPPNIFGVHQHNAEVQISGPYSEVELCLQIPIELLPVRTGNRGSLPWRKPGTFSAWGRHAALHLSSTDPFSIVIHRQPS